MQKMRDGTPIILWLLIISFGLLWVLSDVNFFDAVTAGPRSLGSVNGEPISLEDYNARIQYYSNAYTQQTGGSVTAEQRAFYESQAWEELVNTRLLEQKMDEIGITVTDQELIEMVTGPNPDPFIRQYFQQEDGTINQAALQQALAAEENSDIWILIEDQLRQSRRQQKLNNFITAGLQISDEEIRDRYIANNTTLDVRFIRFPFADVKNEEIEISEDELRAYHRANSDDYKRDESYRFNFVTFSILPTAQDTQRIRQQVSDLRDNFATAENDSLFLLRNGSTTLYSETTVAVSDIREDYKPVTELNVGEVTELIQTGGRVNILKKTGQSRNEVSFVIFSLDIIADPFTTVDQQFEEADDFLYYAQETGSLEEEADQRGMPVRNGFTTKGNPFIPGLGSSQQILNFLERADEGEFSEVLELQNDFAVVQLIEIEDEGIRPLDEVRAQVENTVRIQKRKEIMRQRVETLLETTTTLELMAQKTDREIQEVSNLKMNSNVLRGAGREPAVIGRLFAMPADEMGGPIEGETGIYVASVSNKQEADVSLMDETAKQQLSQQILQQKNSAYLSVWLEELKEEATIKDNRSRLLR
jgi:peptidyl-prolyl cis-trans isomerase D